MAQEFRVPAISDGVKTVDLAALRVKEGDVITANTIVAEVETDKAAAEIECPFAGRVVKISAKPGDTIEVGSVLLVIEAVGASSSAVAAAPAPAPAPAAAPAAAPAKPAAVATPSSPVVAAIVAAPVAVAPTVTRAVVATDSSTPSPAGPATRRLARELGVNLQTVNGSGAGGRITQDDVKLHVKGVLDGGINVGGKSGGQSAPALPDFSKWGATDREPLSKIGKAAATNLSMCWNVIPHVTQHDLVDITELEIARKRLSEEAAKTGAPKVTMTAIVIKAAAICLKEFPKFNSSLDPQTNELVYRRYFNIGCAVDTPNGLLVPVVKSVDQKSISEVAGDLTAIAARARERKLSLDEMQGSCFTITNLGGIGGTAFTPIVNYPEVAILGLSRGKTELKLVNGQVVERLMLPLSLSYDHRVVNGADAARFVVRLGQLLSDYFQLAAHC